MSKTMTRPKIERRTTKSVVKKTAPRARRVITPVYDQHIEITPGIRGGKPRIAGRRIAVEDVVAMHLYHGQSVQYMIDSYGLTPAQVYAALTYYYDHRTEIDGSLEEGVTRYEAEKRARPSLVAQKLAQQAASSTASNSPHA